MNFDKAKITNTRNGDNYKNLPGVIHVRYYSDDDGNKRKTCEIESGFYEFLDAAGEWEEYERQKTTARVKKEMKLFLKECGLEFNGFWRMRIGGMWDVLSDREHKINAKGGWIVGRNVSDAVFEIAIDEISRFTPEQRGKAADLLSDAGCFEYADTDGGRLPVMSENKIGFSNYVRKRDGDGAEYHLFR